MSSERIARSASKVESLRRGMYVYLRRLALVLLLLLLFGLVLWSGLVPRRDIRQAAEHQACRDNLRRMWMALSAYVQLHDALPLDEQGRFSMRAVGQILSDSDAGASLQCPARRGEDIGYFLRPTGAGQINSGDGSAAVPVIYDKPHNHRDERRNQVVVNVLLSNGEIRSLWVEGSKYQQWNQVTRTREAYDAILDELLRDDLQGQSRPE